MRRHHRKGSPQNDWLRAGGIYLAIQAAILAIVGFKEGSYDFDFLAFGLGVAAVPALLFAVALLLLDHFHPSGRESLLLTAVAAVPGAALSIGLSANVFRDATMGILTASALLAAVMIHLVAGRDGSRPARAIRPPKPATFADQIVGYMAALSLGLAVWMLTTAQEDGYSSILIAPVALLSAFMLATFAALPYILGLWLAHRMRPSAQPGLGLPIIAAVLQVAAWWLWWVSPLASAATAVWILTLLPLLLGLAALLQPSPRAQP